MSVKYTTTGAGLAASTLPYTGFSLWIVALVAVGLLVLGFSIRRLTN